MIERCIGREAAFIKSKEINELPRIRYVESDAGSVIPDKTLSKADLSSIFNGQDIESAVQIKLRELGIFPKNREEVKMLSLLENPLIHRYPAGDSPAKYFLEVIVDKDAILASYLPSYTITHPHPHSSMYRILENYHRIAGEPYLHLGNNKQERLESSREVPLDTLHQLEAIEKPAFTLIVMKNAGLVDRKNWHK